MMSYEEFRDLSERGNVVPVTTTAIADTETPVSVYLKLRDLSPHSFLLESVEGGTSVARYSFLGVDPFLVATVGDGLLHLERRREDLPDELWLPFDGKPALPALRSLLAAYRGVRVPGSPRLTAGAVGYVGYEAAGLAEDLPTPSESVGGLPDISLMFCDSIVVFDNLQRQVTLVSNALLADGDRSTAAIERAYERAVGGVERLRSTIEGPLPPGRPGRPVPSVHRTSMSQETFERRVRRAQEYIQAGDAFQVVLSQRMEQAFDSDPFLLYRALRRINPSPYLYYLDFDGLAVAGASPEMFLRLEDGLAEMRPIAGTRRRGASRAEDEALERELLNDAKERAEHLMLVDLGRNDLGRICSFGTVGVGDFMTVERYSHVMHLVSSVSGRLRPAVTALDALFACFPAGTLSGAPKIRAMEIIAELEGERRGLYGGAVGYIDFNGNMDSAIAIRTIVSANGRLQFQAGAGIVFDSRPEREYQETMEKLGATLRAADAVSQPGLGERR